MIKYLILFIYDVAIAIACAVVVDVDDVSPMCECPM